MIHISLWGVHLLKTLLSDLRSTRIHHTRLGMTSNVLEELLVRLQQVNLVEQPQRQHIVELLRIHQEASKDIDMRLMALTPILKRCQIIKVAETESPLAVCLERLGVHNVPQVHRIAPNLATFIAQKSHTLDEHRMHCIKIELALFG